MALNLIDDVYPDEDWDGDEDEDTNDRILGDGGGDGDEYQGSGYSAAGRASSSKIFPSASSSSLTSPSLSPVASSGYYAMSMIDDSKYYWREEDYEPLQPVGLEFSGEECLYNDEGLFEVEFCKDDLEGRTVLEDADKYMDEHGVLEADEEIIEDSEDDNEEEDEDNLSEGDTDGAPRRGRLEPGGYQDPDEDFFFNQNDVVQLASLSSEQFKNQISESSLVLPLRPHGPALDDFLEAVIDHPTKYAQIVSLRPHVESTREPKPIFPKERLHPPLEFVEAHARFLYVDGLPPLEVDGEAGDLENPIHRSFLQRTVASLVNVDSSAVFPASTSSAFVGFPSPVALAQALASGPTESVIVSPPAISLWRGPLPDQFKGKGGAIVDLTNIPPGNTPLTLMRALFPPGSEVETAYRDVSHEDFAFRSSTRVLLRFASREQAESAVGSILIEKQLQDLGRYAPRLLRARRELVHAGYDGPNRSTERRVMGRRLVVDGDMPSKSFYLSHAGVVHVRNLDSAVTQPNLSAAFDRYCARRRDVAGSVEFVTCHAGLPTGCAYVGFDIPGEAEAALQDLKGVLHLGATRARVKLVRDRRAPGQPEIRVEKRKERSVEELLDDLDNWEKYVSPEDLKTLEGAGIAKVVLDEALRNIRYNNKTFGSYDSALRSEALEPQKMDGELYKELVQLYVSTLIDCLPTEDKVGEMYEATHFPDEPIDLSVFQTEKERQKRLLEKRTSF
jgi:hypothetical protein